MPTCQGRYAPPEAVALLLPQARTILKYALFYHGNREFTENSEHSRMLPAPAAPPACMLRCLSLQYGDFDYYAAIEAVSGIILALQSLCDTHLACTPLRGRSDRHRGFHYVLYCCDDSDVEAFLDNLDCWRIQHDVNISYGF